jgi:hypothetical protein
MYLYVSWAARIKKSLTLEKNFVFDSFSKSCSIYLNLGSIWLSKDLFGNDKIASSLKVAATCMRFFLYVSICFRLPGLKYQK